MSARKARDNTAADRIGKISAALASAHEVLEQSTEGNAFCAAAVLEKAIAELDELQNELKGGDA